jgi:hypothetical protein
MPKKKPTPTAVKKVAKKPVANKAAQKKPTQKRPTQNKAAEKKAARNQAVSLGRPTISAEEKLFMLFHDDYHARQIFEFLRAETVGDLEQFTPQEIIHRLSRPIRETVDRIRTRLAERHRCLKDDALFAAEHLSKQEDKL